MARDDFTVTGGSNLRCRGWRQEGLLRLLENVLAVAEDPDNLIVYAALGPRSTGLALAREDRRDADHHARGRDADRPSPANPSACCARMPGRRS